MKLCKDVESGYEVHGQYSWGSSVSQTAAGGFGAANGVLLGNVWENG